VRLFSPLLPPESKQEAEAEEEEEEEEELGAVALRA